MISIKLQDIESNNGYPKLMKRKKDDLIVLFNNLTSGVVLFIGNSDYKFGNTYTCFNPNDFSLYDEKISLFN